MASNLSSVRQAKATRSIGLPVYIVSAIVILGAAAFYYFGYVAARPAPDVALTPEARDYVHNQHLPLSDVEMKATVSYLKLMVVELNGKIGNTGDRPLDSVEIYCSFYDTYGQLVLRKRVPIVSARMGGLKPGQTKSFRLPFDEIPDSWNQKMPGLVIASLKFL